ncbi:hypothetical protein [Streptantibioticus ferralitis]|uniref:Uncharacterized protein n=1 Tax=Streptantibioticus ferralitis TaxID=236510 RepID=A0ABT5YWP7_9ACTN|nr:hypothetical protein [Streptantibioticus ferralitis]MDF2255950.1 hypothetical protein [Streptantibioticus ferralitis]
MDVIGLIIVAEVMAESAHDNVIGTALLVRGEAENPTVSEVFVDAGFKDEAVIHGATPVIDMQVVAGSGGRAGSGRCRNGGSSTGPRARADTAPASGARLSCSVSQRPSLSAPTGSTEKERAPHAQGQFVTADSDPRSHRTTTEHGNSRQPCHETGRR